MCSSDPSYKSIRRCILNSKRALHPPSPRATHLNWRSSAAASPLSTRCCIIVRPTSFAAARQCDTVSQRGSPPRRRPSWQDERPPHRVRRAERLAERHLLVAPPAVRRVEEVAVVLRLLGAVVGAAPRERLVEGDARVGIARVGRARGERRRRAQGHASWRRSRRQTWARAHSHVMDRRATNIKSTRATGAQRLSATAPAVFFAVSAFYRRRLIAPPRRWRSKPTPAPTCGGSPRSSG